MAALWIAGNVLFGCVGMLWGNRLVACFNFSVAALLISQELIK
jgi:hypothetical protein